MKDSRFLRPMKERIIQNVTKGNSDIHTHLYIECSHCMAPGLDKEKTATDFTVVN